MNRFVFSSHADLDMDELIRYLRSLPLTPAQRIGAEIQQAIAAIATFPDRAPVDEPLSHLADYPIRRMVCGDYLLFYHSEERYTLIVGVLHGRRDIESTMRKRLR